MNRDCLEGRWGHWARIWSECNVTGRVGLGTVEERASITGAALEIKGEPGRLYLPGNRNAIEYFPG